MRQSSPNQPGAGNDAGTLLFPVWHPGLPGRGLVRGALGADGSLWFVGSGAFRFDGNAVVNLSRGPASGRSERRSRGCPRGRDRLVGMGRGGHSLPWGATADSAPRHSSRLRSERPVVGRGMECAADRRRPDGRKRLWERFDIYRDTAHRGHGNESKTQRWLKFWQAERPVRVHRPAVGSLALLG